MKEIWNSKHKYYDNQDKIFHDGWLDTFENLIEKTNKPIIDLGCGNGNNALFLIPKGKSVISCDFSEEAINIVKKYIPQADTRLFDMTKDFPLPNNSADIVIADLCIHYFDEETTFNIINQIKRVLTDDGVFLFRVNSVKDVLNGAMSGEELEPHFFFTDGMPKRFFDKKDLALFFKGWEILFYNEENMNRYENQKILWKCAVKKIKA